VDADPAITALQGYVNSKFEQLNGMMSGMRQSFDEQKTSSGKWEEEIRIFQSETRSFQKEMINSQASLERQLDGLMRYLQYNNDGFSGSPQVEEAPRTATPIRFSKTAHYPSSDEGSNDDQGSPTVPVVAIVADDSSAVPPISAQDIRALDYHAGLMSAMTKGLIRKVSVCPQTDSM
jgi:hypothetical protein